jgi:hypothetical protein
MKQVARLRAMGSLCRQTAAYNPERRWKLLAEAQYWEHLADLEMHSYFEQCNVDRSNDVAQAAAVANAASSLASPLA